MNQSFLSTQEEQGHGTRSPNASFQLGENGPQPYTLTRAHADTSSKTCAHGQEYLIGDARQRSLLGRLSITSTSRPTTSFLRKHPGAEESSDDSRRAHVIGKSTAGCKRIGSSADSRLSGNAALPRAAVGQRSERMLARLIVIVGE